jgi:methanogenic corrinoid protein MtbC1
MIDTKNENALISIGGLSRASGISAETLRNWERRYGFPEPIRLDSGHRRYPWELVGRLRLIRQAINMGYKPSFAVAASESELRSVLADALCGDRRASGARAGDPHEEIRAWITAVERFDSQGLEQAIRRCWLKYGAHDFVVQVAVPFLEEIGNRWAEGRLEVAHEHFASEVLQSFLARQWRQLSRGTRRSRAVLANLEGELHNLGLHMAAVFLALNEVEVLLLGPNTPRADIDLAARERGVDLLVIGFSQFSDMEAGAREITALRRDLPDTLVMVVGGNEELPVIDGVIGIATFTDFHEWLQARRAGLPAVEA